MLIRLLLEKLSFNASNKGDKNLKKIHNKRNINAKAKLVGIRILAWVSMYSKVTYNNLNANGKINSETNSDPNKGKSLKKKILQNIDYTG